ncbi:MAG: lytic transglycosylase domain-containing protein [Oscillospiraceae bacterium]|nr:lytic transglycosylase domain-containing protein [Oscillospiraceae bacterium]
MIHIKRTVIIIIIIIVSIGLGYAYERVTVTIEKKSHPLMYEEFVDKYSQEYTIPPEIIYSVINTESRFKSDVVSNKGAVGLMQITTDTFDWLMTKTGEALSDGLLYDPETNIKYGTFLLKYLYNEFNDWDLVFAAYNAGLNRVKNDWMNNPDYIKDGEIQNIPFDETKNYIKKVNNNIDIYKKLYFSNDNQ